MDIPFQIPNGTNQIIIQIPANITNEITIPTDPIAIFWLPLFLAIGAIGLAIITGIGLWKTHQRTRESNKELQISNEITRQQLDETKKSNLLHEKESKIRLRPLLEFIKTKSSLQGREGDYKVRLYYTIRNSGTVTAREIIRRSFESNNTEINHLVKEWDSIKNDSYPIGTIPQGEAVDLFNDIPWKEGKATTNWIIWFEYEYFDIKEKCVIVFPNFGSGLEPVPHRWFVHDDVIKAEKLRDDERAGKISAPT